MKKIITIILTIVLAVSTVMAFTSCGEPSLEELPADERAIELDKLSSEKMDQATSYDAKTSGTISFRMNGIDVTADISGKNQLLLTETTTLMHQEESIEISIAGKSEITKSTSGYSCGKAYISEVSSGKKTAFYSEMTYDEYMAYLAEDSDDVLNAFNAESASEKTSAKLSDGGWSLIFEKFNDKAKAALTKKFDDHLGDTEVTDAKISIVLDDGLYYKSFIMDLFFHDDSDFKEFSFRIDFSDINAETIDINAFEYNKYTQIADIRVLDKLDKALGYMPEDGEKGEVNVRISQRAHTNGKLSLNQKETSRIVYETVDGKFKYEIDGELSTIATSKYVIKYEDGTQTVELYSESGNLQNSNSTESDDDTQRAYVLGIINTVKYNRTLVKSMKISEDVANTYILSCDVSKELIGTSEYFSAKLTVEVTLDDDGNVSEIASEIYVKYDFLDRNSYMLTEYCTFGENAK